MKTKPFDLEKALAGHPVVTRNGREVTQLHLFDVDIDCPLYGVINERLFCFPKSGKFVDTTTKSTSDLFMKVETKKIWYNLYKGADGTLYSSSPHRSRDKALIKINKKRFYVTTIEVEEEV